MSVSIVRRWGRDLAVAIPEGFAGGLAEGDEVEVVDAGREIVIRRRSPKLTLEEMFAGRSDEEWRALYAGACDWGPDVGREWIEE